MKRFMLLVTLPFTLLVQQSAQASVVSYTLDTTVKNVVGSALSGIGIGEDVRISFSYDTDAQYAYDDTDTYVYGNSSVFAIGLQADGLVFSTQSPGANAIDVTHNLFVGAGQYYENLILVALDPEQSGTLGGYDLTRVSLSFSYDINCNTEFCNYSNPVPMLQSFGMPDHAFPFEQAYLRFDFAAGAPESFATLSLNSGTAELAAVPLPVPALLLFTGLVGLASFARRR